MCLCVYVLVYVNVIVCPWSWFSRRKRVHSRRLSIPTLRECLSIPYNPVSWSFLSSYPPCLLPFYPSLHLHLLLPLVPCFNPSWSQPLLVPPSPPSLSPSFLGEPAGAGSPGMAAMLRTSGWQQTGTPEPDTYSAFGLLAANTLFLQPSTTTASKLDQIYLTHSLTHQEHCRDLIKKQFGNYSTRQILSTQVFFTQNMILNSSFFGICDSVKSAMLEEMLI